MFIKKDTEYAVLGLSAIVKGGDKFQDARVIAREKKISESLLPKIFQRLAAAGILESRLGPGGGFRMLRDPREVTLLEIIQAVQLTKIIKCYAGEAPYCPDETCKLRTTICKMEKFVNEFLSNTVLSELLMDQ